MLDISKEALTKLVLARPEYVRDALADSGTRFEEMARDGDSYYEEPARKWRHLTFQLEVVLADEYPIEELFDEADAEWLAAAILWHELNKTVENDGDDA